jgi:3-oxoacyl-[acyl-carrier-protein] synthase-3
MVESTREVLDAAGLAVDELDWVVPHQASDNIITGCASSLGLPLDKVARNFDRVGNTSAASIPIVLDEYRRAGRFRDGDRMVLTAVGAGMAWGAAYLVWHDYGSHAP